MARTQTHHLQGIGRRLRIAREAIGLSTRNVAKLLSSKGKSISHVTIGNYERGRYGA
jgi:transcriptional regulator with XRE-family HTH domain